MNIGMILDNEFTGDPRVENEVSTLQESGFSVYVLCLNFGEKPALEDFHGAKIIRINCPKTIIKKLRALTNTLFDFYPHFWSNKIISFVNKYKIDILHIHDLYMLSSGFLAQKKLKKSNHNMQIVGDLHENYVEGLKKYKFSTTFPGNMLISIPKWEKTEIEWIKKLDYTITVIEEAVDRYSNLGINKDKFTVVANYVNPESFIVSKKFEDVKIKFKNNFLISYVGGFDTHRGLESVIRSIPKVKDHIKNVMFVLVGSGKNSESLLKLAKSLNIDKFVSFEGWQVPEKLPSYIQASDICLIPHLKTIHTDNTIPHKLFQYMLLQKPIIATNCNPIKRIINSTETGLIYDSDDQDKLAAHIIKLYENPQLRTQMSENGKKAVKEKYSWDVAASCLCSLYKKIQNSRSGELN